MLGLIELLTQMWLAHGGVHPNDKPFDFGGAEQDPDLSRDLTCPSADLSNQDHNAWRTDRLDLEMH